MATPIRVECRAAMRLSPDEIAARVLDLADWPSFRGWGPLPGIRSARFETRTEVVVGTRIAVENRDGSTHVEEIVEWRPPERLQLRMSEFSKPLRSLATHFVETWELTPAPGGCTLVRTFELHPTHALAALALRVIAAMLRRAVARHLREMR